MAGSLAGSAAAGAQLPGAGDTAGIEVIGLERWTRRMLEDSLARHAPGVSLASVASAAALRRRLGFADAEVTEFYWQDDAGNVRGPTFLVSVIEPHDSARVQWRTISSGALSDSGWPSVLAAVTDSAGTVDDIALGVAVAGYGAARDAGPDSAFALVVGSDPAGAFRSSGVWRALVRLRGAADLARATATLRQHPHPAQRLAAIGVLQNFPGRDEAWHALVLALRDPHPYVRGVAIQSLAALEYRHGRRVDWRPASRDLRLVLGGTNLSAFIRLIGVLQRTEIDPALAPILLSDGNAELLLAHAGSDVHMVRRAARDLLGRLSRRPDAGVDGWRRWAATLRRPGG